MPDVAQPPLKLLPDRVRLSLAFDPGPMAADVGRFGAVDWTAHYVTANYDGDWSALPLRGRAGETHPVRLIYPDPNAVEYADTAFLDRAPAIRAALSRFECPLQMVRLMRLAPGSRIKQHHDPGLDAASGCARLHVPLTAGPGVEFLLNGSPVAMIPGSVWYLRLADPHSASNLGTQDRVHLVIDATVNAWLAAMLSAGAG